MQLPERFLQQPRTQQLDAYVTRKYSRYGYPRARSIAYNREFVPASQKRAYSPDRYRFVENASKGLRFVGIAHELMRLNHTGWYMDGWQEDVCHGVVYQLPARDGAAQYVPGVDDPCNDDCACLDFHSVTDDKEDAARMADSMAESWAEDAREARAKDDAEQRLEEIESEIHDQYAAFRQVAAEIRAYCEQLQGIAVVRQLVREHWQSTKAEIRKLRREQGRIETEGFSYGW